MKRITIFLVGLAMVWCCTTPIQAATDADIEAAIEGGLIWLAGHQNPDGSWGGYSQTGHTGMAVKKFEHFAITMSPPMNPLDPAFQYYTQVKTGLDFLFTQAAIIAIGPQPAGDPDSDGDGIGVFFTSDDWHRTYETGIALMAIAESGCPDSVVNVPGSPINGWTYHDVAVDAVDYLAWSQIDVGVGRGGWCYTDPGAFGCDWSDNSNSGYAALGLAYAQAPPPEGFALPIPQFVKDELNLWIDYIQNDGGGADDGGSGYDAPDSWVNCLKTGNLLFQMSLVGDLDSPRLDRAIAYLERHWYDLNEDPGWRGNNFQAMYCIMKGAQFQGLDLLGSIDWYADLADYIVNSQLPDGSWGPDYWTGDMELATAWALLTLEKAAPPPPQVIVALDIKPQSCPNPLNVPLMQSQINPAGNGIPSANAVLPVAILGTAEFDVSTIDPTTLALEGVAPTRWALEDVATPVVDGEECECTTAGPDGYMDLTLKFPKAQIIAAIGPVIDGEVLALTLTGDLIDNGTAIIGTDCVIIRLQKRNPHHYTLLAADAEGGLASWNHPNPFNASTTIDYIMGEGGHVNLTVYNITGQIVATLIDREQEAGQYSVTWEGRNTAGDVVASGMYLYRLTVGEQSLTRKMVLLK